MGSSPSAALQEDDTCDGEQESGGWTSIKKQTRSQCLNLPYLSFRELGNFLVT